MGVGFRVLVTTRATVGFGSATSRFGKHFSPFGVYATLP